ncbi:hypothetical protein AB0M39_41895 [Streptomyces sp. NPDC051907]|uniref:hypothetical protein n=1 Tax=Streptomyces sp. NPDC051907 TaxID=3155284 RepID=UPI00341A5400
MSGFWDDPDEQDDDELRTDIADPATGRVRLCARRCDTCIFRPGNLMHLQQGRVKQMVETCVKNEAHVTCHDTLVHNDRGLPGAMCRGWEQHPQSGASIAVRWMSATGLVTLVDPENGELTDADYRALPPLED